MYLLFWMLPMLIWFSQGKPTKVIKSNALMQEPTLMTIIRPNDLLLGLTNFGL